MIIEVIRCLNAFHPIMSYQYVGFGSVYFVDFVAIHRALGLENLISIESESRHDKRVHFNRPFGCVEIKIGHSNDVLPNIDWGRPSVVWLDFDSMIENGQLVDIKTVAGNAISGSLLIVTFDVKGGDTLDERRRTVDQLRSRLEAVRLGPNLSEKHVAGQRFASLVRSITTTAIQEELNVRNSVEPTERKIHAEQILYITYKDRTPMLSLAWLIVSAEDSSKVDSSGIRSLPYVRRGDDVMDIDIPLLTPKEVRYFDAQLPCSVDTLVNEPHIDTLDLKKYAQFYRFFPHFMEVDPY